MPLIWVLVALAAVVGGGYATLGWVAARGAPAAEAAAAATGLALAVVPYVFARALAALGAPDKAQWADLIAAAIRAARDDDAR